MGLPVLRDSASASSPQGYQSTGFSACCWRYGLVSNARRLGMRGWTAETPDDASRRRAADRNGNETEDEGAAGEDDGAAGEPSGGEGLAEEDDAPKHAEHRHEQRHGACLHRAHVGDEAVVEDEGD